MDRHLDGYRAEVRTKLRYILICPPLLFLGIFYFYPLVSIFWVSIFGLSFAPENHFDLHQLKQLVSNAYYLRVLWFTTWQAALSTLLTLVLALPSAYIFGRYDFKGKALIQALTTVPFVLPTVVTAAAFHALLGNGGLINRALAALSIGQAPVIQIEQTMAFFLLAHIFYNYTVIMRIVGGFWSGLPANIGEAAQMLGASRRQVFLKVTLPLLGPAILAASLLVFIFCFTSFGVILILGGPRLATVEVEIYRQAVHLFNLPMAAALSLIQIIFTFGLMTLYTRLESRTAVSLMPETARNTNRLPRTLLSKLMTFICIFILITLLGAPIIGLFISSILTETGLGFTYYLALLKDPINSILYVTPAKAIAYSLGYAFFATLIALVTGTSAAAFLVRPKSNKSTWLDPLFMLPLSTSAVTLGFGFIIALDEPPLNLRTSIILPAIAHALVAFPFVIRSLLPAWRSIPNSLKEAAAVLGATPLKVWQHVDWPILSRALMVAAVFAFAISMGEFGATVFVARPQTPTIPLAIYRFLGQPGALNYGQAMAMSCVLVITTVAGLWILDRSKPLLEG